VTRVVFAQIRLPDRHPVIAIRGIPVQCLRIPGVIPDRQPSGITSLRILAASVANAVEILVPQSLRRQAHVVFTPSGRRRISMRSFAPARSILLPLQPLHARLKFFPPIA